MPEHDKYQLRPRTARSREPRGRGARRHHSPLPLSKYRRKTANARERSRMREINQAFETLRKVVPAMAITGNQIPCEKLTKITTLRLAMRYIASLVAVLRTKSCSTEKIVCSDYSDFSNDMEPESNSDFAEDSLYPFDAFFAEFNSEILERTFSRDCDVCDE